MVSQNCLLVLIRSTIFFVRASQLPAGSHLGLSASLSATIFRSAIRRQSEMIPAHRLALDNPTRVDERRCYQTIKFTRFCWKPVFRLPLTHHTHANKKDLLYYHSQRMADQWPSRNSSMPLGTRQMTEDLRITRDLFPRPQLGCYLLACPTFARASTASTAQPSNELVSRTKYTSLLTAK